VFFRFFRFGFKIGLQLLQKTESLFRVMSTENISMRDGLAKVKVHKIKTSYHDLPNNADNCVLLMED